MDKDKLVERPWQPWERNYSGNRVGVQEQQGENENWMILHVESGGAKTTTSLRLNEAWDLAVRLSPSLRDERLDLFAKMRKAQDALHQFTWADTIAPLLRKVADDWDCDSSQCEFASDDMGGLSCPCMEDERGCRAVEANELRQFADALECAAALRSHASTEVSGAETELDANGEAMMCEGCASTKTIKAILARHGPGAIACCPERKMVAARWFWERALAQPLEPKD